MSFAVPHIRLLPESRFHPEGRPWAVCRGTNVVMVYRTRAEALQGARDEIASDLELASLRCPRCGKHPGAASGGLGNWKMDFCEECGLDADPEPYDPDDIELPDDPYAGREELRRLHEAQV